MLKIIFLLIIFFIFGPQIVRIAPVISVIMFICLLLGGKWAIIPFCISLAITIGAIIIKKYLEY